MHLHWSSEGYVVEDKYYNGGGKRGVATLRESAEAPDRGPSFVMGLGHWFQRSQQQNVNASNRGKRV
jgi:hypothetical protein